MRTAASHTRRLLKFLGITALTGGLAAGVIWFFYPDAATGDANWAEFWLYFLPAALFAFLAAYHLLAIVLGALLEGLKVVGRMLAYALGWVLVFLGRVLTLILLKPLAYVFMLLWRGLTIVVFRPVGAAARFISRWIAQSFRLLRQGLTVAIIRPVAYLASLLYRGLSSLLRVLWQGLTILIVRPVSWLLGYVWLGLRALGRAIRWVFVMLWRGVVALAGLSAAAATLLFRGIGFTLRYVVVVPIVALWRALKFLARALAAGVSWLVRTLIIAPLAWSVRGLGKVASAAGRALTVSFAAMGTALKRAGAVIALLPRQLTARRLFVVLGLVLLMSIGTVLARPVEAQTAADLRPTLGLAGLLGMTAIYIRRRPIYAAFAIGAGAIAFAARAALGAIGRVLDLIIIRPLLFIFNLIYQGIAAVVKAVLWLLRTLIVTPLARLLRGLGVALTAIGRVLNTIFLPPITVVVSAIFRGFVYVLGGLWIGLKFVVTQPFILAYRVLKFVLGFIFGLLFRLLRLLWAVLSLAATRLSSTVRAHPRAAMNISVGLVMAAGAGFVYQTGRLCNTALHLNCQPPPPPPPLCEPGGPPGVLEICVVSSGTKVNWLSESTERFNQAQFKTAAGKPIWVNVEETDSGDFYTKLMEGRITEPTSWTPGEMGWVNDANVKHAQLTGQPLVTKSCPPTVYAVIGFGMWRSMAEAMGWPDKPIGWDDIVALAADDRGWDRYGHPEWGQFKFGHTHPGYSNTGFLAMTGLVYSTLNMTEGLTPDLVGSARVVAAFRKLEENTDYLGTSTRRLSDLMVARGPKYLHAMTMNESSVILTNKFNPKMAEQIVLIIPSEGAYWSEQPLCLIDQPWVSDEEAEAAGIYEKFLLAREQQDASMDLGFRPTVPGVRLRAPIDFAHGTDPRLSPSNTPNLETLTGQSSQALKDIFQQTKKKASIVLALDTSGSMKGEKMTAAMNATVNFLQRLNPDDEVMILTFGDKVTELDASGRAAAVREELAEELRGLTPTGQTALYDAICAATTRMHEKQRTDKARGQHRLYGIVLLSDGKDTSSETTEQTVVNCLPSGAVPGNARLYTIAYGLDADQDLLSALAKPTNGRSYTSDPWNIEDVYLQLSAEQ